MGFLYQLHFHHTSVSKKNQGLISIIFLTYVFSPHCRTTFLDSIFIHTCQILHYLQFVSPSISTSFLFYFLFHLITEFEFKLHQIGPNILFTVWLASIFSSVSSTKILVSLPSTIKF